MNGFPPIANVAPGFAPRRDAPVLRPDAGHMPPRPDEGAATRGGPCAEQRVQLAGGLLNSLIVHPSVVPFEQLYRRLPEEGMFSPTVSASRPFTFELGAFRVPDRMAVLLFDLRPDIFRFSGVDPGDFIPIEERRFASIMGFEITVDQRIPGNVQYQLDPIAIQRTTQAFPTPDEESNFNIAAANSFANAAGVGTGLMPQRPTRYGAQSVPFTLFARSGQTVQVRCVIFRPVPSPIAFVEYDVAGMLVPSQWLDQMLSCAAPTMQVPR